jgi:hypothetical protein
MATAAIDRSNDASAVFKLIFAAGSQLHGATAPFLASNVTGFPSANNATVADILSSYWISFVVTHDPNSLRSSKAPVWPNYMSGAKGTVASGEGVGFNTLQITYESIEALGDPDASARCDFFGSQGTTIRN